MNENLTLSDARENKRPTFNINRCYLGVIILALAASLFIFLKSSDNEKESSIYDDVKRNVKHSSEITIIDFFGTGAPVAELSTYKQEVLVNHSYSTSFLFSQKKLRYTQKYEIRYGVNLDSLRISSDNTRLSFDIVVTSITPVGVDDNRQAIIESDDGFINKLQDEEYAKVEKDAREKARLQALQNDIAIQEAKQSFIDIINRTSTTQSKFTLD